MSYNTNTLEWKLVQGLTAPEDAGPSRLQELSRQLVQAGFKEVLFSPEGRQALALCSVWQGLTTPIISNGEELEPTLRLIIAVALMHAFVQANFTGPDLSFEPKDLLPPAANNAASSSTAASSEDLDAAALPLLTLQGEPAYHLATYPSLLLLSARLLKSLPDSLQSKPWWLLRLHLVHLSLLDEAVPMSQESLDAVTALTGVIPESDQDLLGSLYLELGLYYHAIGSDKLANKSFVEGARKTGLEFELSGALGKKTRYQVNAISQLVLLAESRQREGDAQETTKPSSSGQEDGSGGSQLPETLALNDDTLLEETEFTKVTDPSVDPSSSRLAHLDPSNQPALHPLDQSLLVSLCLSQRNSAPDNGLTASQMAPFLSRVIAHPRNWSVHTTALLLRARLESQRSRTVERSTLQLQALIDQMPTSDSTVQERLKYFHQLPLLSRWEMEKELATRFISLGVNRSALEIFTRLEMWEDAVGCLQRMEREEEAEKIVRDLLEGNKIESDLVHSLNKAGISETRRNKMSTARQAKLWCLLGDLALTNDAGTHDPEAGRKIATGHYEKAWEMSGQTSSRSMRSLGTLYFGVKDYDKAVECYQKALVINPQYSRVWFTVGVCFVRQEKWIEARDAFRREVGVDEEDAEGWNNLAAVYLRLGETSATDGQSTAFDNKLLAFRALRQGLRHAYANWRMWQNYMVVAIDVGELSESARAMTRVVEEVAKRDPILAVDVDVLDKLVDAVTRDDWSNRATAMPKTSNEGFGLLPILERLFDQTILTRISDNPRVWRAHARLLRWKEDWQGAMEDYMRAYRCGGVSDQAVEREVERWRAAVVEIEELVGVLQVLGPKAAAQQDAEAATAAEGGKKKGDWRFQARGIVRTFMGRTKDMFEGEPEWDSLKELLDDLKRSD